MKSQEALWPLFQVSSPGYLPGNQHPDFCPGLNFSCSEFQPLCGAFLTPVLSFIYIHLYSLHPEWGGQTWALRLWCSRVVPYSAKAGGKSHQCESGNLFFVRCHILSDLRRWKSPEFFKWKEKWTFSTNPDLNWGLFPCCPLPLSLLHLGLYSLAENLDFTITSCTAFPILSAHPNIFLP